MLMYTSSDCTHAQTVSTSDDAELLQLALNLRPVYCPLCGKYHIEEAKESVIQAVGYS